MAPSPMESGFGGLIVNAPWSRDTHNFVALVITRLVRRRGDSQGGSVELPVPTVIQWLDSGCGLRDILKKIQQYNYHIEERALLVTLFKAGVIRNHYDLFSSYLFVDLPAWPIMKQLQTLKHVVDVVSADAKANPICQQNEHRYLAAIRDLGKQRLLEEHKRLKADKQKLLQKHNYILEENQKLSTALEQAQCKIQELHNALQYARNNTSEILAMASAGMSDPPLNFRHKSQLRYLRYRQQMANQMPFTDV